MLLLDATITQPGTRNAADPVISCAAYGDSGTHIDTVLRPLYITLPASHPVRIRDFNMGPIHAQTARIDCTVIAVRPVKP
jgi:hypothetical protein